MLSVCAVLNNTNHNGLNFNCMASYMVLCLFNMTYETNYAYKILSDELRVLRKAIKEGNWEGYSESLKDRMKKCKDLSNVLKMLDEQSGTFYRNTNY